MGYLEVGTWLVIDVGATDAAAVTKVAAARGGDWGRSRLVVGDAHELLNALHGVNSVGRSGSTSRGERMLGGVPVGKG